MCGSVIYVCIIITTALNINDWWKLTGVTQSRPFLGYADTKRRSCLPEAENLTQAALEPRGPKGFALIKYLRTVSLRATVADHAVFLLFTRFGIYFS